MLLALCVLVVSSQKCTTVNTPRSTELSSPLTVGSPDGDTRCNGMQGRAQMLLFVRKSTYCMSVHIFQKARESLQSEVQSAIERPRRELPCLSSEPPVVPRGIRGPQPFTLWLLILTRHSSTNTNEEGGGMVCARRREAGTQR